MKKLLALLLTLCLVFPSMFLLTSCGGEESGGGEITLSVYNWGEYMSDGSENSLDVNAAFERYYKSKYGKNVKILYTTYDTNENMYSKLKNNAGSYDVIFPSDYMIERMIEEEKNGYTDILYEYDATTLENFKYISSEFTEENSYYDPYNRYSVPYTYGMVGIIYNTKYVDAEDVADKSWDLLWNEKYRGKILQFNNPRDAFGTAMYKLGYDVNTLKKAEWDEALSTLKEQKKLLQAYVSDEIFNKMTTESAYIAPYFAGDFITMYYDITNDGENPEDNFLDFYYPSEGTNYFVDAICITQSCADAGRAEIAKEYINFLLSPEIALANAIYIGYASPHNEVKNNKEYREDELGEFLYSILYSMTPSEANATPYRSLTGKYVVDEDGKKTDAQGYLNSSWEKLRIYSAVEPWLHVVSIALVVGLVGICIWSVYIKKKRSRHYRLRDKEQRLKKAMEAKAAADCKND